MTEHTHHPAANAPVQSHEPVHPQWLPEASAPYIAKAVQAQVAQAADNHAITIPERIDRILARIALYEAKLGI